MADGRIDAPTLAIWQDPGDTPRRFDAHAIGQSWATDLSALVLPGGHFPPDGQPTLVAAAIETPLT